MKKTIFITLLFTGCFFLSIPVLAETTTQSIEVEAHIFQSKTQVSLPKQKTTKPSIHLPRTGEKRSFYTHSLGVGWILLLASIIIYNKKGRLIG
ncbi:hypothetical protein ACWOFR_04155 [Carnobacterium gallinarum]|uniref:hypothetical protein n=1 Tax=Carnobacterium gallinarum TaxID=2749 RepID=UPI00055017FA|nr:hypothetical protein [Carnobacterium gallinarum]